MRPVERFDPWFDDPQPLLLQDTLITQCWSNGWQVIFNRGDIGFDLRTIDSCSCWQVRGALHQNLLDGERWTTAEDSLLVVRWRKDGDGLMDYWRVDRLEPDVRRFRMDIQDTVRLDSVFTERLHSSGVQLALDVWFRATEIP